MKILSSYAIKLNGDLTALENSINIYRKALHVVIPIVEKHWDDMMDFENMKQRMSYIERLIHTTKKNEACYYFDVEFPKFPSYLRRAVINRAIGIVSSYRSNLENWEENKIELEAKGEKPSQIPRLSTRHFDYPAYYKNNLFRNFNALSRLNLRSLKMAIGFMKPIH